MKHIRTLAFGLTAAYVICLSASSFTSAAQTPGGIDNVVATNTESEASTSVTDLEELEDWEYTLRRRPPKCRGGR